MTENRKPFDLKISLSSETCDKLNSGEKSTDETEPPTHEGNNEQMDVAQSLDTEQSQPDYKPLPNPSEVPEQPGSDNDKYAEHVHYEENVAVYTDPSTKHQYVWCDKTNQWISREQSAESSENPTEDNSVKYGFENNTHTYTDADGSVYIWDTEKNAWFPRVDDDFLAHYQMSYGFVDNTTKVEEKVEVEKPAPPVKKPPEEPKWFDIAEEQNNKVYVSNLPLDLTEEEFVDIMQKCGLVMKDPATQKMKIKLYTKPNSEQFKGDALCTYIRVESVDIALKILDGYVVRNHRLSVQRAKFQMKGAFDPTLKPKKKRKKDLEKLKKMQERLFDWRPEKMRGEKSKHERIVIIKNLFEPSLFDNEVHLILEYQQDMREECSKCGEVKKVTLYDRHPEGVAQVTMKEPEDAEKVVQLINGRWFGKRQLTAAIWDGKTKYKMEETDADLNKRIDEWNKFLEDEPPKT